MAKRRIFCDRSELTLLYDGSRGEESLTLNYNEIAHIRFTGYMERRFLFFKVPSEKIEIKPSKKPFTIIYSKSRAKELFDRYKAELAKYASDYKVTFFNDLDPCGNK